MRRLYLPFSKKLWLVEALSTEDLGWVLISAVRTQSATMIELRRLQAAEENLSNPAVPAAFRSWILHSVHVFSQWFPSKRVDRSCLLRSGDRPRFLEEGGWNIDDVTCKSVGHSRGPPCTPANWEDICVLPLSCAAGLFAGTGCLLLPRDVVLVSLSLLTEA